MTIRSFSSHAGALDLSHLSEEKRAIVERRLKGRAETPPSGNAPAPTSLLSRPELWHAPFKARAFVQERLRFAGPGHNDYRLYFETWHEGLDAGRFRNAWLSLYRQYDVMRSRISGAALVVAPPETAYDIVVHDARKLSPAKCEALIESERARVKNIGSDGPCHAVEIAVIHTPEAVCVCLFSFDLLVMDLPSVEFLALHCRRVYDGKPLHETCFHVQDYRHTEEAWLASDDGQRARQHWEKRIALAAPRLRASALVSAGNASAGYGYVCRDIPHTIWAAGCKAAAVRGLSGLVAVRVLFTDLLRILSGTEHFSYEARGFQRLAFHRDIHELLGQFTLGHLTGSTPARPARFADPARPARFADPARPARFADPARPARFADRVKAEADLIDRDALFAHFDAASLWQADEPEERRGGKIIFTNTCNRFEEFVRAGTVPPMRWFGIYQAILQYLPDTALEYVLVENDGTLENHWFLNQQALPTTWADRTHALYCKALEHLCTEPAAWDAPCVFTAALGPEPFRDVRS